MSLEQQIDEKIGEVRTETLDLSFGEIVNLHENEELIIQPEYQRLFRWSDHQKSQLIESILLELPIPQIFVIENQDGVLELIDGLQRTSSVIQFIQPDALLNSPGVLRLDGCSLVEALNGCTFEDLPLSLRLRLKRSPIRTVVIKRQSQSFLKYEMFKRLNTGGANLEPQEIRNCSARMLGESGIQFYTLLVELTQHESFSACASYLPQAETEKKGNEELVLRYLALKNGRDLFRGSVKDWLDDYMEDVLLGGRKIDFDEERSIFGRVFNAARAKLTDAAFVRYRGDQPVGSLAPAYFEAITMGILDNLDKFEDVEPAGARSAVTALIQSEVFRSVTGPGANSRQKLDRRIELVGEVIQRL